MIDGYVNNGHHSREAKEDVYRIKGFVKIEGEGTCILNFAFGRWNITPLTRRIVVDNERGIRLTAMLARGEGRQWEKKFSEAFSEQNVHTDYHAA